MNASSATTEARAVSYCEAGHFHNEVPRQLSACELAGIALLFALYGSFYRQVRNLSHRVQRTIFVGLFVSIVIRKPGDTERFDPSFPLSSIAFFSPILANRVRSIEVAL